MTDRERLMDMFERAGVVATTNGVDLDVKAKDGPANTGYDGFITTFSFNPDDSLKSIASWE